MRGRSILVGRHATTTVELEEWAGSDGQGKPTYDSPVEITVRIRYRASSIIDGDGTRVSTSVMAWVPADQTPMPEEDDRITWNDSTFIVVEVKDVLDLGGDLQFRKIKCREE